MRTRITVAALAAALLLPLTGCGSIGSAGTGPSTAGPSASPTIPAARVLAAAVAKTQHVSLAMVLAGDTAAENVTGTYDAVRKIAAFTEGTGGDRLKITVSPDDMYLSGLADFGGKVMRLRTSKLATTNPINLFADPVAPFTLLSVANSVEATSATSFTGKLNLSAAKGTTTGARKFLAFLVRAGGSRVGAVGFVATVDAAGYLTELHATFPGTDDGKDGDYDITLSKFGQPVTNKKPTGRSVIEAPAEMYTQS